MTCTYVSIVTYVFNYYRERVYFIEVLSGCFPRPFPFTFPPSVWFACVVYNYGQVRHGGGRSSGTRAASTNRLVTSVQKRRENMSVYSETSDVRLGFGLEGTVAAMREGESPAYADSVTLVLASAKQSLD